LTGTTRALYCLTGPYKQHTFKGDRVKISRTVRGAVIVAAGLFLTLTSAAACATDGGKADRGGALAPITEPGNPADTPLPTEEPALADSEAKMGADAVTLESGLVISVSKPKAFKPTEYAAMGLPRTKSSKFFVVTVKIQNNGPEALDASIYWQGTSGAEGDPLDQVFDGEGIGNQPSTAIRPTKRQTFKIGFHQPTGDLSEIVLEGSVGFGAEVTFVGKL
jgi:hypothetical protein